jgi:hypothetical protein
VADEGVEKDTDLDVLQCMKCNQEFPKNRAAVKLRTASTANSTAPKGRLFIYFLMISVLNYYYYYEK